MNILFLGDIVAKAGRQMVTRFLPDIIKEEKIDFTIVDVHAEATSEKAALAWYLDGRATLVVGTHTHVPTCDERVLPGGTAFVTDADMSGALDSVLGVEKDIIIAAQKYPYPQRF